MYFLVLALAIDTPIRFRFTSQPPPLIMLEKGGGEDIPKGKRFETRHALRRRASVTHADDAGT